MTINRRDFVGGLAAAFAFGCPGWQAARAAGLAQGARRLRFGVLSDVHIYSAADVPYFTRALEYFRGSGVDAVVICGDIADKGRVDQLQLAADAWNAVFPGNRLPDGSPVEKLFVAGNHDWNCGNNTYVKDRPELLRYDFRNNWKTIWGDDSYSKIWQKTVKGYTFIGNHWDCTDLAAEVPAGQRQNTVYDDLPAYLSAHAAELAGTKPFFYIQHVQQLDTCFGSRAWDPDTGVTTAALAKFPNAVTFSGHSHFTLTDDRSIWQGAFTAVNAGSLRYTGLDDADHLPGEFEYENGYTGSDKTMAQYARWDGKQGMLVTVYDDAIVYHRREFYGEESRALGEDWVQPLPFAQGSAPYAYAVRAAALSAPEFPAGARLAGEGVTAKTRGNASVPATTFSFRAANAGALRPHHYEVKFTGADASRPVVRRVLAQGFNMPLSDARASGGSFATLAGSIVPAGDTVRVEVTPVSAYGTRGRPIAATVDGNSLRSGTAKFGGLSVVGI